MDGMSYVYVYIYTLYTGAKSMCVCICSNRRNEARVHHRPYPP